MRLVLILAVMLVLSPVARADYGVVVEKYMEFDPATLTVFAGDQIIFDNQDDTSHNVELIDPNGDVQNKGVQKPGEKVKITFSQRGTYTLYCFIHSPMKMTVVAK